MIGMIKVTHNGMVAPLCPRGVSQEAFDSELEKMRSALAALQELRKSGEVGFLDLPTSLNDAHRSIQTAEALRKHSTTLLVLGIGGSSLGGQALLDGCGAGRGSHRVVFFDNVDPSTIKSGFADLDANECSIAVVTKSGGTLETAAQFIFAYEWLVAAVGEANAKERIVFVTDPKQGALRALGQQMGVTMLDVPPSIGGRFSVLTPVGLLPAAFAGVDVHALMSGAQSMAEAVTENAPSNPAFILASSSLLGVEHCAASSLVFMPYSDRLRTLGAWFVQLWAESLGKRLSRDGSREVRVGQTPVQAIGATDQHAQVQLFVEGPQDKMVWLLGLETHPDDIVLSTENADLRNSSAHGWLLGKTFGQILESERRATRAALLEAGLPVIDLSITEVNAATMGALFVLLEATTALAGIAMDINPFDQPGVEAGKVMALGLLGREDCLEHAKRVLTAEGVV